MKDKKNDCEIYVLRHGETEYNIKNLVQGTSDSVLTSQGEQQAENVAKQLRDIHFDEIFSSDLIRAKRTAEIIALERDLAVKATERIREQHFGKFEGKPGKDFLSLFTKWEELSDQERFEYVVDETMETNQAAVTRFITFLREVAVAYPGKRILIVAHGGLMRYFLIKVGFGTFETVQKFLNTGHIRLHSDGIDFTIDEVVGLVKHEHFRP